MLSVHLTAMNELILPLEQATMTIFIRSKTATVTLVMSIETHNGDALTRPKLVNMT